MRPPEDALGVRGDTVEIIPMYEELALRIEEDTRGQAPSSRTNLPVLSQGRGRRALGR